MANEADQDYVLAVKNAVSRAAYRPVLYVGLGHKLGVLELVLSDNEKKY